MESLCLLVVVLGVLGCTITGAVYLIGAFFRALNDSPKPEPTPRIVQPCRNCGTFRGVSAARCKHCGFLPLQAGELADLRSTGRLLDEFRENRLIDDATFESMRAAVRTREAALHDTLPKPAKVAQPAPFVPAIADEPILDVLPVEPVEVVSPSRPAAEPVAPPTPPSRPRRSWGELLASFMEERHILWGELVGGFLIVGCSVALVLSLWQSLQRIPLFPFLILAALTSALFGIGRYTLRRWRLESTSRGLLVIALLLVPLNFLVLAGLSPHSTGKPIELAIKLASLPLFAWLVVRAGALLFDRRQSWLLALAVVGASASALATARLFDPDRWLWLLSAAWAVGCYAFSTALALRTRWSTDELDARRSWDTLGFLVLTTFPQVLALGFVAIWAGTQGAELRLVLNRLASLVALAGVPLAASGLLVQRKSQEQLPAIVGTITALIGILIHASALALSWPEPIAMLIIGVVMASAWTAAAACFHLPLAHVPAIAGLTAAAIAGVHIERIVTWRELIAGESGTALAVLAVILAVVADRFRQRQLWQHGAYHAVGAATLMTIALVFVGFPAAVAPLRAAAIGFAAAGSCLILSRRWDMPILGHIGAGLIPLASLPAFHLELPGQQPLWAALLASEAIAISLIHREWRTAVGIASALSVATGLYYGDVTAGPHAATMTLLAIVAVIQSHQLQSAALAWIGAGALLAALAQALTLQPESPPRLAAPLVFLSHASLLLPFCIARRLAFFSSVSHWLGDAAKVSSLIAAATFGWFLTPPFEYALFICAAWLAFLWLSFAIIDRAPGWYTASQAATAFAAIIAVAAALDEGGQLLELLVRSFDRFGIVLIAQVIGWSALRLAWRNPLWEKADWPAFERMLLGVVLTAFALISAARLIPGTLAEFSATTLRFSRFMVVETPPGSSWILLALLAVALALHLWLVDNARRHAAILSGLLAVLIVTPTLVAAQFSEQRAVASAWRWGLSIAFVVGCVPFWFRDSLAVIARRCGIRSGDEVVWRQLEIVPGLRFALLAIAGGVPLAITGLTMGSVAIGNLPPGPLPDTFFRGLGFTWSHGIPLAFVVAGMVGHALRDRLPQYAFGAGLLVKFLVCGGFLVAVATAKLPFDDAVWLTVVQRFALAAAIWTAAWLVTSRWLGRFRDAATSSWHQRPSAWWNAQLIVATVAVGSLLTESVALLVVSPDSRHWLPKIAAWPVTLAFGLTLLSAWARARWSGRDISAALIGIGAMGFVVLGASHVSAEGPWPLRVLMLGWAACTVLWTALSVRRRGLELGTLTAAGLTTLLAFRAASAFADHSVAALSVTIASAAGFWLAWLRRRDDWALAAGLGLHVAASLFVWGQFHDQPFATWLVELLQWNALAGGLCAAAWLGTSRRRNVTGELENASWVQVALPTLALLATLVLPLVRLVAIPNAERPALLIDAGGWLAWLALAGVAAMGFVVGTRQRLIGDLVPSSFGLVASLLAACTLARWDSGDWLSYHALLIGWASTAAALLWFRLRLAVESTLLVCAMVSMLVIRAAVEPTARPLDTILICAFAAMIAAFRMRQVRLLAAQLAVGAIGLALSMLIVLTDLEFSGRIYGPVAVALLCGAAGLLASVPGRRQLPLTIIALSLGVVMVAEAGIAVVPLDAKALWLHRTVALLSALTLGVVAYTYFPKRYERWSNAAREVAPYLGLAAALVLVLSVVQQGFLFDKVTKRTPLAGAEVVLLVAATIGLIAAAATFAVRPALDPFRVPDRWRPAYVYACELLLVMLFLHLRFNVPGLFPKIEAQTWGFVIMGIAFAGVGLGELFRRVQLDVLVAPVQRTGLFLPLLPLLMFWLKPPTAIRDSLVSVFPGSQPLLAFFDQIPTDYGNYSILWFLFGALYAWLAISRQSFRHALFAALAGNVGIWSLLHHGGIPLAAHPQLWLVPLALIVLISEQYHHATLRPELSTGLRYLGLGLLYLSSTADFFLAGLGNSVLLPLALAVLSVLGVLSGILLRVRSFLFLGVGFLVLVILSMIWHAAVGLEQTWLWWVSGIILGIAILALFAVFEKRRQGVLNVIEELRTWR